MSSPIVKRSLVDRPSNSKALEAACNFLAEIESLLEAELGDTQYDNTVRVKSKRKRGGPFLIKPIGSSKSRRIQDGMVYNPDTANWEGGEDVNKKFNKSPPGLIVNKGNRPAASIGRMVWDEQNNNWVGNEEDAKKFEKKQPFLIAPKGGAKPIKKDGMEYDPVARRWVGNEDILADFGDDPMEITPAQDDKNQFKVGNEFTLSEKMIGDYARAANSHTTNTSGWWSEKARMDLFIIRTMAILRIVYDVKNRRAVYEMKDIIMNAVDEPLEKDLGPWEGSLKIKLPKQVGAMSLDDLDEEPPKKIEQKPEQKPAPPAAPKSKDDDYDDFFVGSAGQFQLALANKKPAASLSLSGGAGRPVMKTITLDMFNAGVASGKPAAVAGVPSPAAPAAPVATPVTQHNNNNNADNTATKQEAKPAPPAAPKKKDDDWDDFDDASLGKLRLAVANKKPSPALSSSGGAGRPVMKTITLDMFNAGVASGKPAAVAGLNASSSSPSTSSTSSPIASPVVKSVVKPVLEEDTSGLDIPSNGRLTLKLKSPQQEPRPAQLEEAKPAAPVLALAPAPKADDIIEGEEEDDWKDVKIPANLAQIKPLSRVTSATKAVNPQAEAKLAAHKEKTDEFDDFGPLPAQLVFSPEKQKKKEDDEWNDVEIPAGMDLASRLRRK